MGSESALWAALRDGLKVYGKDAHASRVENALFKGHPDVDLCVHGMTAVVELKHRHAWPKRATTPVRLYHFTTEQRQWLVKRWTAGGNAWVLLQVATTYMLFDAVTAWRLGTPDGFTQNGCRQWAVRVWEDHLDVRALVAALDRSGYPADHPLWVVDGL